MTLRRALFLFACLLPGLSRGAASGADPRDTPAALQPVEKPQAVDGTTYTPVTPIYTVQNNTLSYIRFPNANAVSTTTDITAVGATTGRLYGIAGLTTPAHSSPQYSITEILTAASAAVTVGNESVSLYLRNGDPGSYFQHVIYNSVSGFFENAGVCTYVDGANYHALNQRLMNVHTTALAGYPSNITVHNPLTAQAAVAFDVYLASNGQFLGTYTATLDANASTSIPMETIQQAIGWTPRATDYHVNLFARAAAGATLAAQIGHVIFNAALATYVNMTAFCPINP